MKKKNDTKRIQHGEAGHVVPQRYDYRSMNFPQKTSYEKREMIERG